jgi:signal transduction histidine kinase
MVRLLQFLAFIVAYIALDWASFLHPLHGLNITLWNPAPALGLVMWLRFGPITAVPWFIALIVGERIIRGMPAPIGLTFLLLFALIAGYGAIGEVMRRQLRNKEVIGDRESLTTWLSVVVLGTLANSVVYLSLLSMTSLLPAGERIDGLIRFWIGDCVGIVVTMPMLWLMLTPPGQTRLRSVLARWETAGYTALAIIMLWVTFDTGTSAEFQYFYFLFLPVVWAAARQGLTGAAISAFVLQAGLITAVDWLGIVAVTAMEFQMLGAVLALVGFFIGVVVDEQRLAAQKLKQTLRLAAAGEMAAALAHELNQPMTALAAYGDTCEYLLNKGETGEILRDAIHRMVAESGRAAEVVRRVRDFFRTGATQLEPVEIGMLMSSAAARFSERALTERVELHLKQSPAVVFVDRLQIELVLRNLLANAFDAVANQPTGAHRVEVSVDDVTERRVTVTVRDSGPGLSPAARDAIFEPFVSSKSSGLGLGLVISRAIIEAHGGELWAESGDGGIFRFTLPSKEREVPHAHA